ncbi:YncE family protein [Brevibacillus choshinensis]|uniref:YncE family protein n=1 Tax=Brevibacillus choshinensis TaxID=54911 RepID=UPI002E1CC6D5|nr:YncE family protein [Brevibacillus choshinensis]
MGNEKREGKQRIETSKVHIYAEEVEIKSKKLKGHPDKPNPDLICFDNLRSKLQNCIGQIISVTIRGCCDPFEGRLTKVEGELLIFDRIRAIPICDVTSFSPIFLAYATNSGDGPDDDTVSVVSTASNMEIAARIPVGDNPLGVAITPDGSRVYVTNSFGHTVSVISTATNTEILPRISVGDFPFGIAITPDGTRAYVTNLNGNNVSVINIATNSEIFPRIPVGLNPVAIAITSDGSRAYVTNSFSDNISVIKISTNTEKLPRIPVGTLPIGIAITPDGTRAYVTNGIGDGIGDTVTVIRTATNTVRSPDSGRGCS